MLHHVYMFDSKYLLTLRFAINNPNYGERKKIERFKCCSHKYSS